VKVLILFYSMYGHIYKMAEAAAAGAKEAGADVDIMQVPETLPDSLVEQLGGADFKKSIAHVPTAKPEDLPNYDAIIVGTPTRFGNMTAQMRAFWDATGAQWAGGQLVGKVGSVFTSTGTQHGGQETTIITTQITLMHHGMVIAGLPYAFPGLQGVDEVSGGSPYGASTLAGGDGGRMPSKIDLDGATFQGKYVAQIAGKLAS
jgi:NAD(P)H dehydrogenase (quinone)